MSVARTLVSGAHGFLRQSSLVSEAAGRKPAFSVANCLVGVSCGVEARGCYAPPRRLNFAGTPRLWRRNLHNQKVDCSVRHSKAAAAAIDPEDSPCRPPAAAIWRQWSSPKTKIGVFVQRRHGGPALAEVHFFDR